jgi:GNAT superfamily N-acetyltransferase
MSDEGLMLLRPASERDASWMATLLTDEGYPAGPSDIAGRLDAFETPGSSVIVAEVDGEPLGFVAAHILERMEADTAFVRIVALVVDPGARERGVGRLLIEEAERLGRDQGAAFIEITAGHHRPEARRLYESLGFDAGVTTYLRKRL